MLKDEEKAYICGILDIGEAFTSEGAIWIAIHDMLKDSKYKDVFDMIKTEIIEYRKLFKEKYKFSTF